MFKVCVLLAAYNGEKYLEEQMDSILSQSNVKLDIFVSLDVSTDSSFDLLSKYSELENVHFLSYGSRYGSAGQNFFHLLTSVDFSDYDYVAFSDQDDIWLKKKLELSLYHMAHNSADAYSGNVTAFWPDGQQALVKKDHKQCQYDYLFESAGPGCTFVLSKTLAMDIRRHLLEKLSLVESLWLHDWFCYSFARFKGYTWVIGSEPLMLYRQHSDNQVGANSGFRALLNRAKVVWSGEALDRVVFQADFLDQQSLPIKLIKENSLSSLFKLSLISFKCRRGFIEKIIFSIAILALSIKRVFTRQL